MTVLQTIAIIIGTWALVSVPATMVMISLFRSQASANDALTQRELSADWTGAAIPVEGRQAAIR